MSRKTFAVILAALGAINCVSVAVVTWVSIASYQSMWPFPALVLIENALLGIVGLISIYQQTDTSKVVRWVVPGCLSVTVVLGVWSIGFFLLPAAIAFLISALISDHNNEPCWLKRLIAFTAGVIGNLLFFMLGRIVMIGRIF
jgi:hypothetical protein